MQLVPTPALYHVASSLLPCEGFRATARGGCSACPGTRATNWAASLVELVWEARHQCSEGLTCCPLGSPIFLEPLVKKEKTDTNQASVRETVASPLVAFPALWGRALHNEGLAHVCRGVNIAAIGWTLYTMLNL